jgi:DNA polymerase-3 subunit alpha
MQEKYGKDYFLHVCTFNKIKGKEALSVALNYHKVPFMEQKMITKCLPEESFVATQLSEQNSKFGTKSLVLYQLHRELRHKDDNEPKPMSRWCQLVEIDAAGVYKLEGELSDAFDDAIRIDDIYANRGMHACAYCLSDKPIYKSTHVGYDNKGDELIINTEMNASESLGLVKIDFLGIKLLDKIQECREIINGRQNIVLENPYES